MMLVVAAALRRSDGRVLMQCRPPGKHHAGLWEFPGGKVESGETPRFALTREIEEELGIVLDSTVLEPSGFAENTARNAKPAIVILLYTARSWQGEPEAREGGAWGWFTLEEAEALAKPPLDVELLAGLAACQKGAA